jgi:predicted ATPase/DNA-binding SARP family transcriptional activator
LHGADSGGGLPLHGRVKACCSPEVDVAAGHAPPARVEVLGPLRLVVGGEAVDVRGPKRRAVLALLALAEGRTVPVDRLLDALWPAEIPESGRQALHSHVSRLRAHLGPAASRLQTGHDGYRLELGRDELDVTRARAMLASARSQMRQDAAGAFATLEQARALWRGPPLADLLDVAPIAAAVEDCSQLYREVTDAMVASAVAAGLADRVVGVAEALAAADPLREPAILLLMQTLAATGQAPRALRAGREYRRRLTEEVGLDPSPALSSLERDIARGTGGAAINGPQVSARPPTRLFGRDAQIAALHRLLASEQLVTLVGPGGVGKTRVALEVARRSDGATVLLLAPVTEPSAIPHVLAAALGLKGVQGDVLSACVAVLGESAGLLVLDNCEHLLGAVRDTVGVLLTGCPELSVLATSREPLGLAAEFTSRLSPLALPGAGDGPDLTRVPSVAVFLDRSRRVRPAPPPTVEDLRTIADIVRRLDGMPLAIELAAGRLSSFSVTDLQARLDRSLDLLGGGGPSGDARHRTLRATLEWSYQLLDDDERRLFRQLSYFPDGVDLAAAERLAADLGLGGDPGSLLARLVDASMIEPDFGGVTRYRMLETLRAFGLDRLAAAGEGESAGDRLLRWAVELTEWAAVVFSTEREPEADAAVRRELANLRAAWRLARNRGSLDDAAAMVIGLFEVVTYRDMIEVRSWAEELAADPAFDAHPRVAEVLGIAAEAVYHRGDYSRAGRLAGEGLRRARGDAGAWHCLTVMSVAALARGAYPDVVEYSLAAAELARLPRENLGIAALATAYAGDVDAARALNERGLIGAASPTVLSWGAYVEGEIESIAGRGELAEERYLRAIELARTSGATFLVGVATVGLLGVRARSGRVQDALVGYRKVIDYFARTGNWTHQWATLRNLAELLRRLGDDEPAALIAAAADHAPDAPAVGRTSDGQVPSPDPMSPIPVRGAVLEVARQAIERNLAR